MTRSLALWITGLTLAVAAQESQDSCDLRCRFEKGEKLAFKMKQTMKVKLEDIPQELAGVLAEDLIDLDLAADLAVEVKEIKEEGTAVLEGKVRTLNVTGTAFMSDVHFDYDSEKGLPKEEEELPEGSPFGMDPEAALRDLVTKTLKFRIGPQGKISLEGETNDSFLGFTGTLGSFPKEKVAVGASWKSEEALPVPGVTTLNAKLEMDNTFEKKETVNARECALIKSKIKVAQAGKEEEGGNEENPFNLKAKMSGEGEGETLFDLKAGRPLKSSGKLKVKIDATLDNPQGGDSLEIKALLDLDRRFELGK